MPIRSIRSRMTWSFVPLLTVLLALLAYWQMPQVDGYDYFKLVQQWPESSCNTGKFSCPPPIKRDFTIHGLWPASSSGLDPTQCKPSVITKQQLGPLVPSLVDNWPQLANPTANGSLGFWQYEWNKHGSCSESVFAVFNYFQSALILKANNNITKFLEVAGILPGKLYTANNIAKAVMAGTGHAPLIECEKKKTGGSELFQVYVCFSKNMSTIIDCTAPTKIFVKCSSSRLVLYP